MKKILRILILSLIITALLIPDAAFALTVTRGVITASNVAMRKSAAGDSALVGRLKKNATVEIIDTNVNAEWHKVKYNKKTGYVNRIYVNWDPSLKEYKLSLIGKVVNCSEFVNVRSAAKTNAKALGKAYKGDKLEVSKKDYAKGWHQVVFQGKTGYVSTRYLDVGAKVSDSELSGLLVKGGSLSPAFCPDEHGYTVAKVTITAKANSGVKVDVGGTGKSSASYKMPSGSMKTVRIKLNGSVKYSVYITRGILTVGTWNIKRGYGNLLMQGRLMRDQMPDIMGIQEVYRDLSASNKADNLASLKTAKMPNTRFERTLNLSGGAQYGIGILSRYKLSGFETYTLDSAGYEKRILQKAVLSIGGKKVSFYNTHFSYNSANIREEQFAKVAEIMNKDKNKYKMLTGDFNAKIAEFSAFSGYRVIINENENYYDEYGEAIKHNYIDNVIVTKNIKVVNSRIIKASLSDHFPVFTYLVLR